MVVKSDPLPGLYEVDEVAWLDEMARRISVGRPESLDYDHLREFLEDMGIGHRHEVESRLVVLMSHWLKWEYQPNHRTVSWRHTIVVQADEVSRRFRTRTLRNHAEAVLEELYPAAVRAAESETGLPEETFPTECPYTLDGLLATDEVRRYRKPSPPRRGRRKQ